MREHRTYPMIWLLLSACTPMPSGVSDTQTPISEWDKAEDLRFWLGVDGERFACTTAIPIRLHVERTPPGDGKPTSLLAGRFVFTFVSVDSRDGVGVSGSQRTFSGAGGVDYSGRSGMDFQIEAPSEAGHYLVYVTVQSTPQDVRNFLRLAKVRADAGPWWVGNRSTRPLQVEIFETH